MDAVKIVNGISLRQSCSLNKVAFKEALLLAQSHRIISLIEDNRYWVSPALDLRKAIDQNRGFLNQELRLFEDGRAY